MPPTSHCFPSCRLFQLNANTYLWNILFIRTSDKSLLPIPITIYKISAICDSFTLIIIRSGYPADVSEVSIDGKLLMCDTIMQYFSAVSIDGRFDNRPDGKIHYPHSFRQTGDLGNLKIYKLLLFLSLKTGITACASS